MKITRLLPRSLATAYQEHDLVRVDGYLKYYKGLVELYEELSTEGHEELRRLKEKR
ncbi:MAG: hypothetical protein ACREBI_02885 [Nitrosotalea sp.]